MNVNALSTFSPSLTEVTVSSNNRNNSLKHEVISTVRRSHSIDEYMQTDLDEKDHSNRKEESPSQEQVQHLNVVLDTMEDYNYILKDECTAESLWRGHKE